MSRRHVAATNRFVCTRELLRKSWSLQRNFVAATCCKNSNQTEFVRLFAATKFSCSDKDFHKISPVHKKRFVAAMCRRDMLLQLVAGPVHTEWSVVATCCCNLSSGVHRPLKLVRNEREVGRVNYCKDFWTVTGDRKKNGQWQTVASNDPKNNSPRSIYLNSNMTPRLSAQNRKFFTTPLSRNSQKRLQHKETQTKYRKMTRKPQRNIRILIYRTWAITEHIGAPVTFSFSKWRSQAQWSMTNFVSKV